MFNWLFKNNNNETQSYKFIPTIQVNPSSNLHIQCTPHDPHTASNLVINTYISKTNRTLLQTRIQWSRFKFISQSEHSVQNLTHVTGNAYRCQPSDLGSYIQAKVTSLDDSCHGNGEVTIGPIRIDQILKNVVDGALYDRNLRSQIKVAQKNMMKNVDLILSDSDLRFIEENTGQKLIIEYNLSEPRIQLNPKDPTRIFLRFQNDERNRVRNWLNTIFPQSSQRMSERMSERSKNSSSSKSRLFKSLHCANKIQVIFLTRNARDLFLFSQKSFICKQLMKNSIVMQKVQQLQEMKTAEDYHTFLQFMSLRYQIYRLAELAKQYEKDRDQKVRDLTQLQDNIGEMTLTYMKIIQEKGKAVNVDFNQSYSEISIRRQQIMGKRNLRELKTENEGLKQTIRQLNEELQFQKFCKKENNDSMIFNQTSNPFMKKGGQSAFHNNGLNPGYEEQRSRHNLLQINRQYMKVVEENQKLKSKQMMINNPNISQDMVEILQSLHQEDQDPNKIITRLKLQKKQLQAKIIQLQEALAKKNQPNVRLNQSIAHQNNQSIRHNTSNVQESFLSMSNMNQTMISQVAIKKLQQKLIQIRELNNKMMEENHRLRRQRDDHRQQIENMLNQKMGFVKKIQSLTVLAQENKNLKIKIQNMKRQNMNFQGQNQMNQDLFKVRKMNSDLLDEIKKLKIQLEKRSSPIYNSRVIELESQVNFLKSKTGDQYDSATERLIEENSLLKKQIQIYKREMSDKDSKLQSQAILIDRLMNSTDSNSISGKDKSYSQNKNQESVDKLKKKIKLLQQQIVMVRRSADVINRSHDFSMQMNTYNEQKMQNLVKEKEMLLMQNERISKMCEKYAKDAREKNKWQKKALQLQKKLSQNGLNQY